LSERPTEVDTVSKIPFAVRAGVLRFLLYE
jgi:hypothetical protein